MLAEESAQQLISQNLANSSTTGYKAEVPIFRSFDENLVAAVSDQGVSPVGPLGDGTAQDGSYTDFADGSMQPTGNPLDVALTGDAFLAVKTGQGTTSYTRDGALTINAEGMIVQVGSGFPVLDDRGQPITVGSSSKKIQIARDGTVLVDGTPSATLGLFAISKADAPMRIGSNLFSLANPAKAVTPDTDPNASVDSGFLEGSNVSVVHEMVTMIACMRAYEANAKAVQAHDDENNKAVNDVGKVS
jgi:flagellar basal-body rod protein FlgF